MSAPREGGRGGGGSSEADPRLPLRPVRTVVDRGTKVRNFLSALALTVFVFVLYGRTYYSIYQDHFMDMLELEDEPVQAQPAKSSAKTS